MKTTGVIRRIDELGRITLPKELRKTMEINEGDPVEIYVDGETVYLQKYQQKKCDCGECDTKLLRKWNE